jgi:hypothetical protein
MLKLALGYRVLNCLRNRKDKRLFALEGSEVAARGNFPIFIAKNPRGKSNPVSVFSATDRLVKRKEGHLFNVNKESAKLALPSSGQTFVYI